MTLNMLRICIESGVYSVLNLFMSIMWKKMNVNIENNVGSHMNIAHEELLFLHFCVNIAKKLFMMKTFLKDI